MNWFRNLPISLKVNLLIIGAIFLVLMTIFIFRARITSQLLDNAGQERIDQEVIVVQGHLDRSVQDLHTASLLMSNAPVLLSALADENRLAITLFAASVSPNLNVNEFLVVNAAGDPMIVSDAAQSEADTAKDELLAEALLGAELTTILVNEHQDGVELELVSVQPIRSNSGSLLGGLLVGHELNTEFLDELNFGRQGVELALVYKNEVIAETSTSQASDNDEDTGIVLDSDLVTQAFSGQVVINPNTIYLRDNIPYTEAYLPLSGQESQEPTALIVVRSNNEAIGAFQESTIRGTAPLIIGIVLLIMVAVFTVVRITVINRITRLQHATTELAHGEYTKRVEVSGQDEVGKLAQAFNQMAGDIQQRQSELEKLNQSLEQRVVERTAQLKQARDEALASRRIAEENSRLKSEFLSTMSHELRTPMNAIEGFTSIMLKRMGGVEYNGKTERFLNKVQANSQRLLGLINDFLDLSRIESGRLELAYLPISPAEMAQKWQENLSSLADNKGLDFELNVDPELPQTIYGDEESLTKIAINLVGNAIKFTEKGSVKVSLHKRDDQMELQVTDTGMGIPAHARDFIFDEFRQVDQSSKRLHGGTGLGLSIVQKLVLAMGGTVTLQSEVGVGSTFTVLIPIQTEQQILEGVAS